MALKPIDLGVAGDPQTGETIFSGGEKLNSMLTEIFERSAPEDADFRMTGHWLPDEGDLVDLQESPEPGFRIDVNTELSSKSVEIDHNSVSYSRGDQLQFRDERGTWDTNPCSFNVVDGSIDDISSAIAVRSKNAVVTLTCVDASNNEWIMRIDSLRGRFDNPLNETASITPDNAYDTVVYDSDNVISAKLLIAASLDSDPGVRTVSEILVTDNGSQVFSSEYAVINTNGNMLYSISFEFIAGQVVAVVNAEEPSITFRIKTVEYTER